MTQSKVDLLLVEDNPKDAELAIRHLKKNNMAKNRVQWKEGEEALEFIFSTGRYENQK